MVSEQATSPLICDLDRWNNKCTLLNSGLPRAFLIFSVVLIKEIELRKHVLVLTAAFLTCGVIAASAQGPDTIPAGPMMQQDDHHGGMLGGGMMGHGHGMMGHSMAM